MYTLHNILDFIEFLPLRALIICQVWFGRRGVRAALGVRDERASHEGDPPRRHHQHHLHVRGGTDRQT